MQALLEFLVAAVVALAVAAAAAVGVDMDASQPEDPVIRKVTVSAESGAVAPPSTVAPQTLPC